MLTRLSIQNVVLIEKLTLDMNGGLCVLTGETGAGKSILLDALGLALGGRSDAGLVRKNSDAASVTASFDIPKRHPLRTFLKEHDIALGDDLILRRTVMPDGRSKAFLNDAPITVQLLKETGRHLVEVHGQFETQGLLDPATHRATLDSYAGLQSETTALKKHWTTWKAARNAVAQAEEDIKSTRQQEDYLRYAVTELEKLAPVAGEEEVLAQKRQYLLGLEKMRGGFEQAEELISADGGLQSLLGQLENILGKLHGAMGDALRPAADAVNRAKSEIEDISYEIGRLGSGAGAGDGKLEDIEERYFALKECAKKHRCTVDDLPQLFESMTQKLRLITHHDEAMADLYKKAEEAKKDYVALAKNISAQRQKSAQKLDREVAKELPDLKLDKARITVDCRVADNENEWNESGIDHVQFLVSTNLGSAAGPLHKIASGGELSRFMLALKAVLAETGDVPTLVFDEVDSGIGGATADAVGERLARLSKKYQVLVVTHSPQVAARGQHHWHVAKTEQKGTVITQIAPLSAPKDRQEEIARMLSGATVTKEARAAAAKLLEHHDAAA